MDWTSAVDIYCERTSAVFWAEPVNAFSNIAFIIAAIWGAQTARKTHENNPLVWLLIVMAAGIGLGSFLFHTFANRWSELADTVPIWSFVALFIFVSIHRMGGVKPGKLVAIALAIIAALVLIFLAIGEGSEAVSAIPKPDPLNGSGQYAPALIALLILTVLMLRRRHPLRGWIVAATTAFVISLVFRTIDMRVCDSFPLGSHFIWHIFNGVLIALLLQMLVRARAPSA